ncbi:tetratricopeptide repeat protein [Oricola cellulosilytica]|uniref:Tetratricopeptide repeat protein n=1 Tax=Oricola cellulosilytica TaxID=1429082 RepID=A0A4R0P9Q1_9HYPH|nr:tetratricopeptide repeat protein [Oricola cellulosilytica]TCD12388.1 tetratricopeptide repeat protein [Oricola cellulosilytica]
MARNAKRLVAAAILATAISGCQTANIDTAMTASFQADRSDEQLALAEKHFAQGSYGLAEKSYRKAVEATPKDGTAWLGLAASYDQLGRFDLSDRAYAQLIKLEGRRASILNNQGYSYLLRGDLVKARRVLSEAKSLAPSSTIIEGNWQLAAAG